MIYIAGKITGVKNYNKDEFYCMEACLLSRDIPVFNPLRNSFEIAKKRGVPIEQLSREEIIRINIKELLQCSNIIMLRGWDNSRGAILEREIAEETGIRVHYTLNSVMQEYKKSTKRGCNI